MEKYFKADRTTVIFKLINGWAMNWKIESCLSTTGGLGQLEDFHNVKLKDEKRLILFYFFSNTVFYFQ